MKEIFGWRCSWYWFRFNALPVTVSLKEPRHFHWQQIRGAQIGSWFFGAIRGTQAYDCDCTGNATKDAGRGADRDRQPAQHEIQSTRVSPGRPWEVDEEER